MLYRIQVGSYTELEIGQQIKTHLRGGILRFSSGLKPLSTAFRACIMKCFVGDVDDTILIKLSEPTKIMYAPHI